jgi:hypothetical protein
MIRRSVLLIRQRSDGSVRGKVDQQACPMSSGEDQS